MTGFQIIQALLTITEISGLFYLFFLMYERRNTSLWSSLLLGILIAGFCASAIFQRGEVAMYSRYFMLFCIGVTVILLKLFFRLKTSDGFIITALYYETIYFLDIILGYLGQLLSGRTEFIFTAQLHVNRDRIIIMVLSRLITLIIILLIICNRGRFRLLLTKYKLIVFILVVLEYIGLFYCDEILNITVYRNKRIYIYFVFFPLLILFILVTMIVFVLYIEKKNEVKLFQTHNNMVKKSYREMLYLYQNRDRIFHDMQNHILILSSMLEENNLEAAKNYISKIQDPIKELQQKKYTGNHIVNIIMNDKMKKAERCAISVNIRALEVYENNIEDIDWCCMLANLLDNAIEGCQKIAENKRKIELYLVQRNGTIILNISNTYGGDIAAEDNKLLSSKKDALLHGIRMQSVRLTVEKYKGTFEYHFTEERFTVSIALFI